VQVLETHKTKLGADHPDTPTSMNNLALTLKARGFTRRAICLIEDCCKLGSVVFDPQLPNIISSREVLKVWQLEALYNQEQEGPEEEGGVVCRLIKAALLGVTLNDIV
jgi:hypothetical protein